ncbi:IS21 family transposase (plasmid) [Bacillus sp. FJAT-52991]|uniref:IS21 family transposase n=2 Tax=Bacillus kandeliae TaxID=3129297 RepID=A0ABZ2N7I0_9BACI
MIRELKQKGWAISAIARETGFDRKTVRNYINAESSPQSKPRAKRPSKLDPYKPYLLERIKEGTTNCAVLIEEIRAMGYQGKSTILRDFVQPYREAPKKQATVRFETAPGRQAQVDWAEDIGEFMVNGEKRSLYAFIMILSYSRKRYIEFTTDMTQETLMKCHMNAFSYFYGMPQQLLYDNMRTVVTKHSLKQIRFNKKFEDFLNYYGIIPKACKPYRAQTKGKVERAVAYLKTNFLKRRLPETLEELNYEVRKWLDEVVHKKRNQTTQQTPNERFEEERGLLLAWNIKPLYPIQQWELREVSKDCLISYKGNQYSVPYRFVGQRLKIRENDEAILEIYDEHECIATHPVIDGKRQMTLESSHYSGLPGTKKEQEMNLNGLATPDSPTPTSNVVHRSLAEYAALEEGD